MQAVYMYRTWPTVLFVDTHSHTLSICCQCSVKAVYLPLAVLTTLCYVKSSGVYPRFYMDIGKVHHTDNRKINQEIYWWRRWQWITTGFIANTLQPMEKHTHMKSHVGRIEIGGHNSIWFSLARSLAQINKILFTRRWSNFWMNMIITCNVEYRFGHTMNWT